MCISILLKIAFWLYRLCLSDVYLCHTYTATAGCRKLFNQFVYTYMIPACSNLVSIVGAGYLAKVLIGTSWRLASGIHAYFLAPNGIWRTDLKKYGEWAGEETDLDVTVRAPHPPDTNTLILSAYRSTLYFYTGPLHWPLAPGLMPFIWFTQTIVFLTLQTSSSPLLPKPRPASPVIAYPEQPSLFLNLTLGLITLMLVINILIIICSWDDVGNVMHCPALSWLMFLSSGNLTYPCALSKSAYP